MLPSLLVSLATVKFVVLFRSWNILDKVGNEIVPSFTSVGSINQKILLCTSIRKDLLANINQIC